MKLVFHLKNTAKHPFLLSFLRKPARLEKAGSKYDTISFQISDIDTNRRPTFEQQVGIMQEQGLEVYVETDAKRVVKTNTPVEAAPDAQNEKKEPNDKRYLRNIQRVMDYASSMEQAEQSVGHAGAPGKAVLGVVPGMETPNTISFSRDASIANVPGMRKANIGQSVADFREVLKARAEAAKEVEAEPVVQEVVPEVLVQEAEEPAVDNPTIPVEQESPVVETKDAPAPELSEAIVQRVRRVRKSKVTGAPVPQPETTEATVDTGVQL